MRTLTPYISFYGRCREALDFYAAAFNGKVVLAQTFGEANMNTDEKTKDLIMHSVFEAEGIQIMATDGSSPDEIHTAGGAVSLALGLTDTSEQDKIFTALAVDGKVLLSLQDMFWGDRFGMVQDKFGINWMLNCS